MKKSGANLILHLVVDCPCCNEEFEICYHEETKGLWDYAFSKFEETVQKCKRVDAQCSHKVQCPICRTTFIINEINL